MKKHLLIILILFISTVSYCQMETGKKVLSANISYTESIINDGVRIYQFWRESKYLTTGLTFDFVTSDHFYIGIALEYYNARTDGTEAFFNRDSLATIGYSKSYTKSNIILPGIYFGYYMSIFNNFYVRANVKFSYGFGKTDDEVYSIYGGSFNSSIYSNTTSSNNNLFTAELSPQLTYLLTSKIGISLSLGGISYLNPDLDGDNSYWNIDFNPSNWSAGIRLVF